MSTISLKKIAIGAFASGLILEAGFYLWKWLSGKEKATNSRRKQQQQQNVFHEILFFPDNKLSCSAHLNEPGQCKNSNCRYSHEETSLSNMMKYLKSARKCLDVCVFTITCHELANAVVDCHRRGMTVRVITDSEQVDATGSQIGKFRKEGVPVRTDQSSYFMHHKFVIIDREIIINGSFNWTTQAITGNNENLIITNDTSITAQYAEEFNRLWNDFDPRLDPTTS